MAKAFKPAVVPSAARPVARTEVRNSPIPKASSSPAPAPAAARPSSKPVSHDLIARRAYEIWASGQGGSDLENWIRAERELRGV